MTQLISFKFFAIAAMCIALGGSVMALPVSAATSVQERTGEQDDALEKMKSGEIQPYGKIKSVVESRLGGKLVGERLRQTNNGWVYEVRVRRPDGQVIFAVVDAKTGRILRRS